MARRTFWRTLIVKCRMFLGLILEDITVKLGLWKTKEKLDYYMGSPLFHRVLIKNMRSIKMI